MKAIRPWIVHQAFFNKWSADMAYILGFFCADGYMSINPRGSRFIAFQITDRDLLVKIKDRLGSGHKISLRRRGDKKWKDSWRIQIGSKAIFERFITLGITPKKAERIRIPPVPIKYQADFVRGYFDGDGGVWCGLIHKHDRKKCFAISFDLFYERERGYA
ncbi:MAG: LAGLIDADG family homing endonuclease [Candidatus Sungiibacteriota bacterium]